MKHIDNSIMKDILQVKILLTGFNISANSFSGKRFEPKIVKAT